MIHWTHFLDDWPGVVGGFTRRGPHHPADVQSGGNLGHTRNADHLAVTRARRAALRGLGVPGHILVCADQVHGNHVAVARHRDLPGLLRRWGTPYYPRTDALITTERGLALLLYYADCCPVFLWGAVPGAVPLSPAIGLAHCGWRGTVADLAGATVAALTREWGCAPAQMRAHVGPCIGVECYEIGPEVVAAVREIGGEAALRDYAGRTHLDLLALNVLLLERAGVPAAAITTTPDCTRCGEVPLFSWRRDGPRTGRLGALLALR
jgi:YfiH family protein